MGLQDKVIITAALTGVLANRDQCPGIPYTPVEIADEAKRAYDAGATVVHIHGRTDGGAPTWELETFRQIKEEVRKRCPIILNFSTGTMDDDIAMQAAIIRELRPEIAALNMGTMNYAKYSPKRKSFVFDVVFPNTFGKIERFLDVMNEAGVKPELECFDAGHTNSIWPLYDMGKLKKPTQFSFIMGVLGGLPTSIEALQLQKQTIPADATWEVIGIGKEQWRLVASALVLGGNIRVGLEDNFYLPDGSMAPSNGALVEQAAQLVRLCGREVADIAEARRLLSLSPEPS
ncbi:MAG: 3-keto-5-aminohexanoate cleavage protein [Deltaproteobacteria bacterium]|nr:3-keto-5-aminohexanoate cleavage protein [Deltaproteobacteria bacterium]